jgi:hypothetical protein
VLAVGDGAGLTLVGRRVGLGREVGLLRHGGGSKGSRSAALVGAGGSRRKANGPESTSGAEGGEGARRRGRGRIHIRRGDRATGRRLARSGRR